MAPRSAYQERAKRIAEFYLRVDKDKQRVLAHFCEEGIPARTVHRIIRLFDECGDVAFKRIPGRSKKISPEEAHSKIADLYRENPRLPAVEVARTLGVSRSTLFRFMTEMRSEGKETFKAPAEHTFCPTCRQKCDPELLASIRQKKTMKKTHKPKAIKCQVEGASTISVEEACTVSVMEASTVSVEAEKTRAALEEKINSVSMEKAHTITAKKASTISAK